MGKGKDNRIGGMGERKEGKPLGKGIKNRLTAVWAWAKSVLVSQNH
jgi:hypothetical protein